MDACLEGAEWAGVHVESSAEIAHPLDPKVRPHHFVRAAHASHGPIHIESVSTA